MLIKSANYEQIYSSPLCRAESKIVVNGTTYTQDDIISLSTSYSLFGDTYSFGNCVMGQVEITLYGVTAEDVPKFSRVEVWTRLTDGTSYTNWLPKGVFYTKKPTYDAESEMLYVSGYDEMFRTETIPFPVLIDSWEDETFRSVAEMVATLIGIDLEDATQVPEYSMGVQPIGLVAREILSDIARSCNGNWTICFKDEDGQQVPKLRLVRFTSAPSTNYLVTEDYEPITFGGDRIIV